MSSKVCEAEGCDSPAVVKGLCRRCYDRKRYAEVRAGRPKRVYRKVTTVSATAHDRAVAALLARHPEEYAALLAGKPVSMPAPVEPCESCATYHRSDHRCLHCDALPSRKIDDGKKFRPILVPVDMTDERIAAAVKRGERVRHEFPDEDEVAEAHNEEEDEDKREELNRRLEHLGELLATNMTTEKAVREARLNPLYRKRDPRVYAVIQEAGRGRGRRISSQGA